MTKDLFDTTTVPHWRTAATVHLDGEATVSVGDPCHGLDRFPMPLAAGDWVWEVRDADEAGRPDAHRVWEVRLRRADADPAGDLQWVTDLSEWSDAPSETATTRLWCGVDAGIIAWEVSGHPRDGRRDEEELLELTHGVHDDGHVLLTTSGWGDGCYPVAAVLTDGQLSEVRACYVTPDLPDLDAGRFADLLPTAFVRRVDMHGPFTVHLVRTEYWARNPAVEDEARYSTYDTVAGVSGVSAAGEPVTVWGSYDHDDYHVDRTVCQRVSSLWQRLPEAQRQLAVDTETRGETNRDPSGERGFIEKSQKTPISFLLID